MAIDLPYRGSSSSQAPYTVGLICISYSTLLHLQMFNNMAKAPNALQFGPFETVPYTEVIREWSCDDGDGTFHHHYSQWILIAPVRPGQTKWSYDHRILSDVCVATEASEFEGQFGTLVMSSLQVKLLTCACPSWKHI